MTMSAASDSISIPVDPSMAQFFAMAPLEDRQKLELLLRLRLRELTDKESRPLQTIMDEMAAQAEAKGLTPEKLQELLGGE
jgi:hypothetical protein